MLDPAQLAGTPDLAQSGLSDAAPLAQNTGEDGQDSAFGRLLSDTTLDPETLTSELLAQPEAAVLAIEDGLAGGNIVPPGVLGLPPPSVSMLSTAQAAPIAELTVQIKTPVLPKALELGVGAQSLESEMDSELPTGLMAGLKQQVQPLLLARGQQGFSIASSAANVVDGGFDSAAQGEAARQFSLFGAGLDDSSGIERPARAVIQIPSPVGTPAWSDNLANKMSWMASRDMQMAELRLNPPNLGPVEVKVTVTDGETTLHFHSPHAAVREAIESSIPRLREMFENEGLHLQQVDVSHQDAGQGEHADGSGDEQYGSAGRGAESDRLGEADGDSAEARSGTIAAGERMLDLYA